MPATRRRKLEILFRFVIEETLKGEDKWLRELCQGNEETMVELIEKEELSSELSGLTLEDVKVAARACKPMVALSVDQSNLERAIDGWEAALPLAKEYSERDASERCVPPYTCVA